MLAAAAACALTAGVAPAVPGTVLGAAAAVEPITAQTPAFSPDTTTVTTTCTNGLIIVLLAPYAVVPCSLS